MCLHSRKVLMRLLAWKQLLGRPADESATVASTRPSLRGQMGPPVTNTDATPMI